MSKHILHIPSWQKTLIEEGQKKGLPERVILFAIACRYLLESKGKKGTPLPHIISMKQKEESKKRSIENLRKRWKKKYEHNDIT